MAKTMMPEMKGLRDPPSPDSPLMFSAMPEDDSAVDFAGNKAATYTIKRKNKDDTTVEAPVNKAAVAGSTFDTKTAGNNVAPASSIKPAAKVEGKAKQSAAKVEGKAKLAAAKMKDRVKQVETKLDAVKQSLANVKAEQAAAKGIELAVQPNRNRKWKPPFKVDKPEPKVIDRTTERLDEDYIEYLRTRPLKMPSPATKEEIKRFPWIEESIDDILRQHDEKGYAIVGIELLDNGMKRPFRLPVEATAA